MNTSRFLRSRMSHKTSGDINNKIQGRLLASFDCTRDYPAETYLENGSTRIVETKAGKYRETEGKQRSRFAYRFSVEKVGHPHLVIMRYPDDKPRHMGVSDGMTYDMTMGIYTGGVLPLSNTMRAAQLFFFPRWKDCAIQIATWSNDEPAAAAEIEVWELADCATFNIPGNTRSAACRRELGSQWEDPCGYAMAEGAMNHTQWMEHVLAYARHSGQNLIVYPMCWYYGPQFPSRTNDSDNTNILATPDHKLWARATCHPIDWWPVFLKRASAEGVGVIGSLSLIRLSSLLKNMNTDLPSIQSGADTYNNMLGNNQVQSSIQDWTLGYHAKMMLERFRHVEKGESKDLWGACKVPWPEWGNMRNPAGPMFNPLHPTTQEKVLEFVGEIVERYGQWPAFRGISLNLGFVGSVLWFGSLRSGYDDYTVNLFQEETGVKVPGQGSDPERFAKRHEFLTFTARHLWIEWRCRKIHEWVCRIRDRVVNARPDLRLTITAWQETLYTALLGPLSPALQLYARPSLKDILVEGGVDPALLGKEPNLDFDLQIGEARDRATWKSQPNTLDNLCDLHADLFACAPHDVLVYFAKTVTCAAPMSFNLRFGYDGPVKLWIDGQEMFCDPNGTNPALPDKAIVPWQASKGQHEILIAIGSNKGQAWGVLFRLEGKGQDEPGVEAKLTNGKFVVNWLVSKAMPSAGKLEALGYPGDKRELDLKPRDFGKHTYTPLEYNSLFRDANYLDQDVLSLFAGVERPGAFIFNIYAEDWPDNVAFCPDPNDPNLALAWDMDGQPAEGIIRFNCLYPADGWWFESQLRIYDPMPAGEHYLESFAHAVAELDAQRITQGGLFMDKCHTDELRRFALAFRSLPKQKFQTVGDSTDPVAVRTLVVDGWRYFYMVNREYYPVKIKMEFADAPKDLVDLASGITVKAGIVWDTTLSAYELRSMSVAPDVELVGFQAEIPGDIKKGLRADAQRALADIAELKLQQKWITGMDRMAERVSQAIQEKRWAWLRRALMSYIVRKVGQALGKNGAALTTTQP